MPKKTYLKFVLVLICALWVAECRNCGIGRCECQFFSSDDVRALLSIKNDINSDPFGSFSDWLPNSDCVSGWNGVCCNNNGRVSRLNMPSLRISGKLSSSVGKLKYLLDLDLSKNLLTGEIPASLSNLKSLKNLNLGSNQFSGTIFPEIGEMGNLTFLYLDGNQLGGEIPESIGNLVNMKSIWLANNNLSGNIPNSIGNLVNVLSINFFSNQLSGSIPESFGNLKSLVNLWMSMNQLNGSIPSTLGNLQQLSYLWLDSNQLSGQIPDSLGNMQRLRQLSLFNNSLTGEIPPSLGNLSCLVFLQLQSNFLSGKIPEFQLQRPGCEGSGLTLLDLSKNSLSGPIPSHLSKLKGLQNLSLSFNDFDGTIPLQFGEMKNLMTLNLRHCGLKGSIPYTLSQLNFLKILDLSLNTFTGTLPQSFFNNLTALTTISISGSFLSGPLPQFSSNFQLLNLDLSHCSFSSPIPTLPLSLVSLNLAFNSLADDLNSTSFKYLSHLKILRLDNNRKIHGSVPPVYVSILSLSNTSVSGLLPLTLLEGNNTKIQLDGSVLCKDNKYMEKSYCLPQPDFESYKSSLTFCLERNSCPGATIPSYLQYKKDSSCTCSGYAEMSVILLRSSLSILTEEASQKLQNFLSLLWVNSMDRVLVTAGETLIDDNILITLFLFSPSSEGPLESEVNSFISLWKEEQSLTVLFVDDLGYLNAPKLIKNVRLKNDEKNTSTGFKVWWLTLVIIALLLLLLGFLLLALCLWHRSKEHSNVENHRRENFMGIPHMSLERIKSATLNFSEEREISSGGFGSVFAGTFENGQIWAVKRAKEASSQSSKFFERELENCATLSHSNIIKLEGFCLDKGEKILVYEFMAMGCLRDILERNDFCLNFTQRLRVALGVAEGLKYLHGFAHKPMIHRDVNSRNILLTEALEAKLSDFGLMKEVHVEVMAYTDVAGTAGYIDPEYFTNFIASRKSDVFSFGVVLFELITGLPPVVRDVEVTDPQESTLTTLVNWVQPFLKSPESLADPKLLGAFNPEALAQLVQLAAGCTERYGKYRPSMNDVSIRLREVCNLVDGLPNETQGDPQPSISLERYPQVDPPTTTMSRIVPLSSEMDFR